MIDLSQIQNELVVFILTSVASWVVGSVALCRRRTDKTRKQLDVAFTKIREIEKWMKLEKS
jgi:hypothetical protein